MSVDVERLGAVAVLTMQREDKRNAIDTAMTAALSQALDAADDDPEVRAIVLSGGDRYFCAGTDLAETDHARMRTERGGEYGVIRRQRRTPLVAAVEGPALGGGMEIVLACDLVVAGDTATFGLPEVKRGVIAACGGLFRVHRALPSMIANELLLVGDSVDAAFAHRHGLVNRVVPAGQARTEAVSVAARIAENAPVSIAETLLAARRSRGLGDEQCWPLTEGAVARIQGSEDSQEGRRAFFERRAPQWRGR
jgi:enoyl-CoA hydratase